MWQKVKQLFNRLRKPIDIYTSKGNTLIIQAYPRKHVVYVSYRGQVKTAYFNDNTLGEMTKGGRDFPKFKKHTDKFLTAVGQLMNQIINQ